MTTHTIERGDWIGAIAATHNLSHWSVIWDHPANAELCDLRGSPDLLMVGDALHNTKLSRPPASPSTPVVASSFVSELPTACASAGAHSTSSSARSARCRTS